MGNKLYRKVLYWREALGLEVYRVRIVRIDPFQVMDDVGNVGMELVGGLIEGDEATISTIRKLKEDDIVHELLHFRYPADSEGDVRRMTQDLIVSRNVHFQESLSSRERF